ncbi:MAG: response regulator [Acidobacteriota bacterium]|nr:response regulator [Acidobacteriota bacterium]
MSTVLIVDDEAAIRELLSRWLSSAGHSVVEAPDAESALAVLASQTVGVVLCDRSMPGRDGLWLVEQIKDRFPNVAIILATADAAVPPRISMQSGILGYLVKPFKVLLVTEAVADAMAWHRVAAKRPRRDLTVTGDPIDAWLRGRAGRTSAGGE